MKKIKKKSSLTPGLIVAAFISAIVIYALMIYTEKKVTAGEETLSVPVAISDILKGSAVSGEASSEKVIWKDVPVSLVPGDVVLSSDEFEGKLALLKISEGTIITSGMLEDEFKPKKEMKEPVLIGFKAEDYFQTAGGRIRPGDRIHIYMQDEQGDVSLRWSDIYVADAFDTSGESVGVSGEGKTLRYNIYLEKEDVEEFYKKLEAKRLRVALAAD